MDSTTFAKFRQLVYEHSGIELGPGKEALVYGRVGKRMRTLGIRDEKAYLDHVLADATGDEVVHLLDAISTNFTSFFREPDHFKLLESFLTDALKRGQSRFRIWSAACSSGEEPYTIAMVAQEIMESMGRYPDLKILATDISTRVLDLARAGMYSSERAGEIPAALRSKYFQQQRGAKAETLCIADRLQQLIVFRRLNLAQTPYPMQGPFDVIFCRNVMIYFDKTVRTRIVREVERLLRPGGLLLIGHSESLAGIPSSLAHLRPSIYRREVDS
jgi:chemotaxis protein methyltransferase CheR